MNKQEIDKAIEILSSFDGTTDQGLQRAVEMAVPLLQRELKALTQQLNNGWIPVSERLPIQEDGRGIWVLTCATSGLVESNHFCNGRFYDADKNGYKIVAWQPLPPAWKGENYD